MITFEQVSSATGRISELSNDRHQGVHSSPGVPPGVAPALLSFAHLVGQRRVPRVFGTVWALSDVLDHYRVPIIPPSFLRRGALGPWAT